MKRLIVTADDLGGSQKRNEGILLAHRRGIVSSASALVNGPAFRHALDLLRHCPSLDTGLHLNLSEGAPVVPGHRTLAGPDGLFWGKDEARRRALRGRFEAEEIERETEAQIAVLQDAGLRVTRLDGHHHLHVYGIVPEAAARAASRRGLRFVRCPADGDYRELGRSAMSAYARAGLRSTDHFRGAALTGRLDETTLAATLRALPDGVTELMVHPGYAEAPGGFAGPDRETELRALTSPAIRALLDDLGIQLGTFETP